MQIFWCHISVINNKQIFKFVVSIENHVHFNAASWATKVLHP
jgi:hypothetical protein